MKKKYFVPLLMAVCAVVILLSTVVMAKRASVATEAGEKRITITVISDRDSYKETCEVVTEKEFLGEVVRSDENWVYEDSSYGLYIKAYKGMYEDVNDQYWWRLSVADEVSSTGADEVVITDGGEYTWELVQGW